MIFAYWIFAIIFGALPALSNVNTSLASFPSVVIFFLVTPAVYFMWKDRRPEAKEWAERMTRYVGCLLVTGMFGLCIPTGWLSTVDQVALRVLIGFVASSIALCGIFGPRTFDQTAVLP
jgi:hypothetical protein